MVLWACALHLIVAKKRKGGAEKVFETTDTQKVHAARGDQKNGSQLTQDLMPYYLHEKYEMEFAKHDNMQGLLRARNRINKTLNATPYAVVMVSTAVHLSYSVHTIPIWKAYCERH